MLYNDYMQLPNHPQPKSSPAHSAVGSLYQEPDSIQLAPTGVQELALNLAKSSSVSEAAITTIVTT